MVRLIKGGETVLIGVCPVPDRIEYVTLLRIRRQRVQGLNQSVQGIVGVIKRAVSVRFETNSSPGPRLRVGGETKRGSLLFS